MQYGWRTGGNVEFMKAEDYWEFSEIARRTSSGLLEIRSGNYAQNVN